MSCPEKWFHKPQEGINNFVNKKKITTKQLLFLSCRKGGTGVPWLYLKYLIAKGSWFKILSKIEEQDKDLWPDFAILIINLKNMYFFPTFKVLLQSGDKDWQKLANICYFHNMKFWGGTIHEFLKLRKLTNKPRNINNKSTPIKEWGNLHMFGCYYNIPLLKSGRYGQSIKQLLRPPEYLSLSTRNEMIQVIIKLTNYNKIGHFINMDNKPSENLTEIYNALLNKYPRNKIIKLINFIFQCALSTKQL